MREAAEYQDWRDWYDRHESLIVEAFGPENAATFEKFLSAGSIQTTVSENAEESLRAFAHYIQGGRFDDGSFNTLLARERQYQQIADGGSVTGPKLIPFLAAMQGDVDAVAMDRHMRRIIFGEDAGSGHTAQTVVGQAVVRAIAKELGWEPRGVQAVLWVGRLMGEGSGVRATDYREQLLDHRDMITAIQNLPQFVRKADDPELFSLAELETAAENAAILVQAIIYLHEALGTTSPTPEQVRDFISPVSKWLKWLKWFKGS